MANVGNNQQSGQHMCCKTANNLCPGLFIGEIRNQTRFKLHRKRGNKNKGDISVWMETRRNGMTQVMMVIGEVTKDR